jgi:hypothetical protein
VLRKFTITLLVLSAAAFITCAFLNEPAGIAASLVGIIGACTASFFVEPRSKKAVGPQERARAIEDDMNDYLVAARLSITDKIGSGDQRIIANFAAQWKWADTLAAKGKRLPEIF